MVYNPLDLTLLVVTCNNKIWVYLLGLTRQVWMQKSHIEDIVHTSNLLSQFRLVYNVSNPIQDLKWSKKILLQFGGARESQICSGQQILGPNLKLNNLIVLFIVSFLSLLFMFYSSLSCCNQLLYCNNILIVSLPLNPCANYSINGVFQLLPKNKLNWRELCPRANLTTYSELNLW